MSKRNSALPGVNGTLTAARRVEPRRRLKRAQQIAVAICDHKTTPAMGGPQPGYRIASATLQDLISHLSGFNLGAFRGGGLLGYDA